MQKALVDNPLNISAQYWRLTREAGEHVLRPIADPLEAESLRRNGVKIFQFTSHPCRIASGVLWTTAEFH
jgi:hypothetical protein